MNHKTPRTELMRGVIWWTLRGFVKISVVGGAIAA